MRNRARKLRAAGVQVINFAAGELDQDTSPIIKDGARKAIDSGRTQYTDTLGIKERAMGPEGVTKDRHFLRDGRSRLHFRREAGAVQQRFRCISTG
jgi:hypothetical protein